MRFDVETEDLNGGGCHLSLFSSKHAASSSQESQRYTAMLQSEVEKLSASPTLSNAGAAPIVTPVEVRQAISHLNHAQSCDTEGISPILLDHFSDGVFFSVASMFTKFLTEGYVPSLSGNRLSLYHCTKESQSRWGTAHLTVQLPSPTLCVESLKAYSYVDSTIFSGQPLFRPTR